MIILKFIAACVISWMVGEAISQYFSERNRKHKELIDAIKESKDV